MITTITSDEKLRHINNMLSEISNIYQKLLLSKNVPESVFIVMSSVLELGEGCLQKDIAEKSYINKKRMQIASSFFIFIFLKSLQNYFYIVVPYFLFRLLFFNSHRAPIPLPGLFGSSY